MGNGLRVSDASDTFERAAEAHAQRVMQAQAPPDVQRAVEPRTVPAAGAAHEGRWCRSLYRPRPPTGKEAAARTENGPTI